MKGFIKASEQSKEITFKVAYKFFYLLNDDCWFKKS